MNYLLVPIAAFALTSAALAQTPSATPDQSPAPQVQARHHAPDPNRQAAHLAKELNLTPDQTAKVEPILADRDQKMAAIRANTQLTPKDMHQQTRAVQLSTEQQLGSILTADQMQQLRASHQGHKGQGGRQPLNTPPPTA